MEDDKKEEEVANHLDEEEGGCGGGSPSGGSPATTTTIATPETHDRDASSESTTSSGGNGRDGVGAEAPPPARRRSGATVSVTGAVIEQAPQSKPGASASSSDQFLQGSREARRLEAEQNKLGRRQGSAANANSSAPSSSATIPQEPGSFHAGPDGLAVGRNASAVSRSSSYARRRSGGRPQRNSSSEGITSEDRAAKTRALSSSGMSGVVGAVRIGGSASAGGGQKRFDELAMNLEREDARAPKSRAEEQGDNENEKSHSSHDNATEKKTAKSAGKKGQTMESGDAKYASKQQKSNTEITTMKGEATKKSKNGVPSFDRLSAPSLDDDPFLDAEEINSRAFPPQPPSTTQTQERQREETTSGRHASNDHDRTDFSIANTTATPVVATPAATPAEIRDAIQDELRGNYQEMMAAAAQQHALKMASNAKNYHGTVPYAPPSNIVRAEEISPNDATLRVVKKTKNSSRDENDDDDDKMCCGMSKKWLFLLAVVVLLGIGSVIAAITLSNNKSADGTAASNGNDIVATTVAPTDFDVSMTPSSAPSKNLRTESPSNSPTEFDLAERVMGILMPVLTGPPAFLDPAVFDDPGSATSKVLDWLIYEQSERTTRLLTLDDPFKEQRLIDRYTLAHLYIATGGPEWTNQYNFMLDADVCQWRDDSEQGVGCDSNQVVNSITLQDNQLFGELPDVFFQLQLHSIDVSGNFNLDGTLSTYIGQMELTSMHFDETGIYGPIPTEIAQLSKLEVLSMYDSYFEGNIPVEIGECSTLVELRLGYSNLEGSIPTEVGKLTNLRYLDLSLLGEMSGTIPTEIFAMTNLGELDISETFISGQIPSEIGNLSKLSLLLLLDSDLSGTMPTELGQLISLREVDLEFTYVEGTIPSELGNLISLESLYLQRLSLSGTIPSEFGNLYSIKTIHLYFIGDLTGTLPTELGRLTTLVDFRVQRTSLFGPVPSEFVSMPQLERFVISRTAITGNMDPMFCSENSNFPELSSLSSDCLANADTGVLPRITCSCCTSCCTETADGYDCEEQEPQPAYCDNACVACGSNAYALDCGQCPTLPGGDDTERVQLCGRSCGVNESSGVCEYRTDFDL